MDVVKRGEIWFADLSLVAGSESGGVYKPILIIQNEVGNKFSPCVIACTITSQVKKQMKTHVYLNAEKHKLDRDSYALLEQIRTLDRLRLLHKVAHITEDDMEKVDDAAIVSLGLTETITKRVMDRFEKRKTMLV